ncbi:hypothetical protein RhiirA4_489604 [Rhizophagus irregularis]|uniref:Uncharacterized protein n=1 Tax=Rhizophagus irregularis TaxID=588596 RepID=A0A2I1HUZ1_9GLOM|nr:hypothetical protein RhiirA4_489604 [Rhizophagus irregularis]
MSLLTTACCMIWEMLSPYVEKCIKNNTTKVVNNNESIQLTITINERSAQAVQTSFKDVKNLVIDINNKYERQIKKKPTYLDRPQYIELLIVKIVN